MKKKILSIVLIFSLFSIIFSSCKKTESETQKPVYEAPKIGGTDGKVVTVNSHLSSSTNQYAQQCNGYLETVNNISTYLNMMTPPSNAQFVPNKSVGTYTWTWSAGGVTVWMTMTETATKYTWTYDIDYQGTGRITYIYAEENKDGSSGLMNFFGGYSTTATIQYTWTVAADGTINFVALVGSESSSFKYIVNAKPDGSGSVDFYTNAVLFYHIIWNTDGSGSWVYYYGDQSLSGTWS
jgi:hypothetical protein